MRNASLPCCLVAPSFTSPTHSFFSRLVSLIHSPACSSTSSRSLSSHPFLHFHIPSLVVTNSVYLPRPAPASTTLYQSEHLTMDSTSGQSAAQHTLQNKSPHFYVPQPGYLDSPAASPQLRAALRGHSPPYPSRTISTNGASSAGTSRSQSRVRRASIGSVKEEMSGMSLSWMHCRLVFSCVALTDPTRSVISGVGSAPLF